MEITHGPVLSVQINSQPGDQPVWKHLKVKKQKTNKKKTLPQDSKLKSENVTASRHCVRNHYFKNTCYKCPEISGYITSKYSVRIPGNPTVEHSSKRVVFNQRQFHRPHPHPPGTFGNVQRHLCLSQIGEKRRYYRYLVGRSWRCCYKSYNTQNSLYSKGLSSSKCQQLRHPALRYSKAFKKKIRFCHNQKSTEQVEMTY